MKLGVLGGDGIGPEVVAAALLVLDACEATFDFRTERTVLDWSGEQYLRDGRRFDAAALEPIRKLDAVLLGAVGHPGVPRGMLEAAKTGAQAVGIPHVEARIDAMLAG